MDANRAMAGERVRLDPGRRPTADLVVLLLTLTLCALLLLVAVAVVVLELLRPELNYDRVIEMESEVMQVLVGAIVGFIGGRGVGAAAVHDARLETERRSNLEEPDASRPVDESGSTPPRPMTPPPAGTPSDET